MTTASQKKIILTIEKKNIDKNILPWITLKFKEGLKRDPIFVLASDFKIFSKEMATYIDCLHILEQLIFTTVLWTKKSILHNEFALSTF